MCSTSSATQEASACTPPPVAHARSTASTSALMPSKRPSAISRSTVRDLATTRGIPRWPPMPSTQWRTSIDRHQHFDVIVIDPPSFAPNSASVPAARRAYRRLTSLAVDSAGERRHAGPGIVFKSHTGRRVLRTGHRRDRREVATRRSTQFARGTHSIIRLASSKAPT